MASEDIERHVVRKFEICQRLGKGVQATFVDEGLYIKMNLNYWLRINWYLFLQAYGIVWKAIEKRSRNVVALKKCFDAFRNATDAQRTFREIMYLQVNYEFVFVGAVYLKLSFLVAKHFHAWNISLKTFNKHINCNWTWKQALSGHENIIRLQHVIKAENDRDIYLTFDHMETGKIIGEQIDQGSVLKSAI